MAPNSIGEFTFSIGDLARLLGKARVTIRSWETKNLINIPRDKDGNRSLTIAELKNIANWVYSQDKISAERYQLILELINVLQRIQKENTP